MELSAAGELALALQAADTGERRRVDRELGALVGSRCEVCGTVSWPSRAICHRCGSPRVRELALGRDGQLVTYTTVWVPRPGVVAPYVLGQVDLPEGVRIFVHVHDLPAGTRTPCPVRMVLAAEADAVPPFWFEPAEARS
ncbi:MAG TPA: OB-fold domain-containing protein [Solirubrobacteraceae bacterium]|jgi:hypothetical protein